MRATSRLSTGWVALERSAVLALVDSQYMDEEQSIADKVRVMSSMRTHCYSIALVNEIISPKIGGFRSWREYVLSHQYNHVSGGCLGVY